ncbi:MAG: anthranilate synthase component I [Gammaproteobacteria bacterium]|nr:MAG: anthranilate synthase component I [Gammaproteobacteria bacterium]RKZ42916.1 MAG: anthranilate synthase component I [Gammaproteobacteria bacterium]RKZ76615.1 MAG: anthranilate synthase component I [Gammaproteobacteria bacterium]
MTPEQFTQLAAEGYNRIPIQREVLADLDTPLSAYLKLTKGQPYSYLFESVQGGEKWGRYSIIGLPAHTVVRVYDHNISVYQGKVVSEQIQTINPLTWIGEFLARFRVPKLPDLPRFSGGLVGYFGYDTVRYIEPVCAKGNLKDPLETPDILLMLSDEVVVFDNIKCKLHLIVHANPSETDAFALAQRRLNTLVARLRENEPVTYHTPEGKHIKECDFKSGFSRVHYEQAVQRAKKYIVDGDIMQVVLSQRLKIACEVPPLNIYRALRHLNPSPYLYYLNLNEFQIIGSSPEILVRLEEQQITVRPIAGTRPRGHDETEDKALEKELLNDPKECAEHLMLIDLGRNDVGRIAQIGTVQLTENMNVERYSHVMHIVSNVIGQLKRDLNSIDVLKATFPAGTLTGAPKIRAMEIINELEPIKRGIYGGAIGYMTWQGNMDTAIAIRTAVIKNQKLHIQVGAGIVADSVPAKEWEETMNKGRAIFKAVALAHKGL